MSVNQSAPLSDTPETPAAVSILFNLPESLQVPAVLRALICAYEAGCRNTLLQECGLSLSRIALSSGRPS